MSDNLITALVTVLVAIVGLASLAVMLSPNAKTGEVLQSGSKGFATMITAAVAPVSGSGGGMGMNTSLSTFGNGM